MTQLNANRCCESEPGSFVCWVVITAGAVVNSHPGRYTSTGPAFMDIFYWGLFYPFARDPERLRERLRETERDRERERETERDRERDSERD